MSKPTIQALIDALHAAQVAAENAPTRRARRVRNHRWLMAGVALADRVDDVEEWLEERLWDETVSDEAWLGNLAKYEAGYRALREAQAVLGAA